MINKKIQKSATRHPNFTKLLKSLLYEQKNQEIISWNTQGDQIVIKDKQKLFEIVLPEYFNHQNYSSFLRQLNLYGFVSSKNDLGQLQFQHKKFTQLDGNLVEKQKKIKQCNCNDYLIEHQKLKEQLNDLKIKQNELMKEVQKALSNNMRVRKFLLTMLTIMAKIKSMAGKRVPQFFNYLRTFLRLMNEESTSSFYQLIKYLFPADPSFVEHLIDRPAIRQLELTNFNENSQLQDEIQSLLLNKASPSPYSQDLHMFWVNDQDSFSQQFKL